MNIVHRWYCNSEGWAKVLQEQVLPGALRGIELGDHALEVGPGPGRATEWLRQRTAHLTSIEIDAKLASQLRERVQGKNVTVVDGDATAMPFPDSSFSSALSFTMLHHVPAALQDKLLAEVARVLRPGAMFVGSDSSPSLTWNIAHLFDDRNPVDPATFVARLEHAGFIEAELPYIGKTGFGWRARKG